VLAALAEEQELDAAGRQPKRERAVATGRSDPNRPEKQEELIVVGEPLLGLGKRGHDGN
jgi:hypothetical protein